MSNPVAASGAGAASAAVAGADPPADGGRKPSDSLAADVIQSSRVRRVVDGLADVLTGRWSIFGAVLLPIVVLVIRNGYGLFPELSVLQWVAMAEAFPEAANLPPEAYYLYAGPLGAIIAHFLGIASSADWYWFHVGLVCVVLLTVGLMAAAAAGRKFVGVALAVFAAAGVSTVMMGWIGSYDVYAIAGLTIISMSRQIWLAPIGGLIVGATNFEMGVFAFIALVVVGWADGKRRLIHAAAAGVGLVTARLLVWSWQLNHDVDSGRLDWAKNYGIERLLNLAVNALPALAMTWLAAATVMLAWMWISGVGNRARVAVGILIAVSPAFIVADETRVGAVVVWPVLAWLLTCSYRQNPRGTSLAAGCVLAISLVFPPLFIWEGAPHLVGWFS